MPSRLMRLFVLCLFLLSLASTGFAARRSSLGGNLLIKDTDDVFFYPHRVAEYNRLVTFDLGSGNSSGSGGIIFGNESIVFGAFSHRSDFLGATQSAFTSIGDAAHANNGRNNLGGNIDAGPAGGPFNWIDLILGWQGGDNPWGARLSIGRAELDLPPSPAEPGDPKSDVTSVNVAIGFNVNDIDLSGEFTIASAEDEVGSTGTVEDSSPLGFAVSARKSAVDESDDLQLGWLGMFSFVSAGGDSTPQGGAATKTDITETAFVFGAGPVYTPHERTSVAMYGTFEFLRRKRESGTATNTTSNAYVIPGWHIGAEVELASWLQARAGIVSRFAIANVKNDATDPSTETQATGLDFSWHTGIGIAFDDFMIDGYLNPEVITSGTDLLGNSDSLFGLVTASYSF